jgi:uracil-DNA glycosylase
VEEGKPDSHAGLGWEDLTQRLLGAVISAHTEDPVVFVAWGRKAQNVVRLLRLGPKHSIVEGVHPSPLSAHHGYFGSKPFSKVNALLTAGGVTPIDWRLPLATTTGGVDVGSEDPV